VPEKRAKSPKRLVIDTSIARSSGPGNGEHEVSTRCREFLVAVLLLCHHVVMTTAIREEWDRHRSRYASDWYLQMKRRGRKVDEIDVNENEPLRKKIERVATSERRRTAMLKDTFLIEAAQAADFLVISRDEEVRNLFRELAQDTAEIKPIIWINPTIESEACITWLEDSCPDDDHRKLGYIIEDE